MQCRTSFRKIPQTPEALKSDLEIFREAGVYKQLNDRLSLPWHSHWSHSTDSLKENEQITGNHFAVAKTCRSFPRQRGRNTRVCCMMSHSRVYCSLLCFLPGWDTLCHFLIPWWLSGASFAPGPLFCVPWEGLGTKEGENRCYSVGWQTS